jgi:Flp pilus assembly protein CpaB
MTPAKQTEGERALKIRVDAVITASGFILLQPGK